jgi:hypothetical protein
LAYTKKREYKKQKIEELVEKEKNLKFSVYAFDPKTQNVISFKDDNYTLFFSDISDEEAKYKKEQLDDLSKYIQIFMYDISGDGFVFKEEKINGKIKYFQIKGNYKTEINLQSSSDKDNVTFIGWGNIYSDSAKTENFLKNLNSQMYK